MALDANQEGVLVRPGARDFAGAHGFSGSVITGLPRTPHVASCVDCILATLVYAWRLRLASDGSRAFLATFSLQ
jgi:hypothetical protein